MEGLHLVKYRKPTAGDKIYKEECIFCFHTPIHEDGLYICLTNHYALCAQHAPMYVAATKLCGYLHYTHTLRQCDTKPTDGEPTDKVVKLALNVDGGFNTDPNKATFDVVKTYNVVLSAPLCEGAPEYPMDAAVLGQELYDVCTEMIAMPDACHRVAMQSAANVWGGEERPHANPPKISPSGPWKCGQCDLTTNLWLNLTDGTVLCGRKHVIMLKGDMQCVSGNEHAKTNFESARDNPLVVKLGTIDATGADVYSYDEDTEVVDPNLSKHMLHFGLEQSSLRKTELSLDELQIQLNMQADFNEVLEHGESLKSAFGCDFVGIHNLGSSCYVNSVMQCLASVRHFIDIYAKTYPTLMQEYINTKNDRSPTEDIPIQICKFFDALSNGVKYSNEVSEILPDVKKELLHRRNGVRPIVFRELIGRNHAEFSTCKQQDAEEYIRHLFGIMERNVYAGQVSHATDCMRFKSEERLKDLISGQVSYRSHTEILLSLPVPMEKVLNKAEVQAYEQKLMELGKFGSDLEVVRPKISMRALLEHSFSEDIMPEHKSPVSGQNTGVSRLARMATFPEFLLVHVKRFTLSEDNFTPKKLPVDLQDVQNLDLTQFKGSGLQPGEVQMSEERVEESRRPQLNEPIVAQLLDMGFSGAAARKAVYLNGNMDANAEQCVNWVMQHLDDPDLNEEHMDLRAGGAGGASAKKTPSVDEAKLQQLAEFGFSLNAARSALEKCQNSVEQAVEWLFSNPDAQNPTEPQPVDSEMSEDLTSLQENCMDGAGKYKLVGMITHMGENVHSGHYVAHIFKHNKWVLYNDEKVSYSEKPPFGLAYIYLYQRC